MKQHKASTPLHIISPMSQVTDLASAFGPLTNLYIMVYNPNETEIGAYDFEIV